MQAIHKGAVKTGIIGGVAAVAVIVMIDLSVLFYLGFIANNLSTINDQFPFLYYLPVLACIIAMAGVGIFAVRRASVTDERDVAAVSLLAGTVASVIALLTNILTSMAMTYIAFWILNTGTTVTLSNAYAHLFSHTDPLVAMTTFCCCMPVSIFMGIIVAFACGIEYARRQSRKASSPHS
jgi:hypothetical protein